MRCSFFQVRFLIVTLTFSSFLVFLGTLLFNEIIEAYLFEEYVFLFSIDSGDLD